MKYLEEITIQANKCGNSVCGDYYLCKRTPGETVFVLTDGIGSGVYANVAAIFCANRLIELSKNSLSSRNSVARTAESMHRARKEDMIFSAFSLVRFLNNGRFTVYSYEAPQPVIICGGRARPLTQRVYNCEYEDVAEAEGVLDTGDTLVLFSDGVSQAGMGRGGSLGLGTSGFVNYINRNIGNDIDLKFLCKKAVGMTAEVSGGYYADDTTLTMLRCRDARQLTVFSGPPADRRQDPDFARRFCEAEGSVVICGSTTSEIISRETQRKIRTVKSLNDFNSPPEYTMFGAEMVTEGAVILNQLYNILNEDTKKFVEMTQPERLVVMLNESDVITFVFGGAVNKAHDDMIFKQAGIKPRYTVIQMIAEELRRRGKVVEIDRFSA